MKKYFTKISIITQVIILIVLTIISVNIKDPITQNIFFFTSLIISTILWSVVFKLFGYKLFKGLVFGFASICILITGISVYNSMDLTFGLTRNGLVNKVENKISSSYSLLYQTDSTELYLDKENKRLYSITTLKNNKYFYQTNLSVSKNSEYILLYGDGLEVSPLLKNVNKMKIHPSTISSLANYEHLIELTIDNVDYVAPTFIMGNISYIDAKDKNILKIEYQKSDQNYDIYKVGSNLFVQNNISAFITPFKTVQYNKEVLFKNRYIEFMNGFYDNYNFPGNLTFGLSKTIEVDGEDIQRVSFYYEIYDAEHEGGLLMEIVHKNNTADVCYIKEMYAEDFVSAKE